MTIFLSGPMGSGKTTLAHAFARKTGGRVVDLDERLVAAHGASVAELFRTRGESGFRALERAMVQELGGSYALVALGGGTVTDPATRRALLRDGVLITLSAPLDVLAQRLKGDTTRPLLEGSDPRGALARWIEARKDVYAECHATLDGTLSEGELLAAVCALAADPPLVMPLGTRSYPIHIGAGALHRLPGELARVGPSSVLLVCDDNTRPYAAIARAHIEDAFVAVAEVVLAPGESNKTLASVEAIWNAALAARVDRRALVLAVGGGVVGDLAGFAAATMLRGVGFAQIPTTLLAMVDASVGGKTGFDRPEGKNLVGAFHQPRFVIADQDTLPTLADRELACGLAEVVKAAWLTGEGDVAALERDASGLVARDPKLLGAAIRRAVATKIAIVAEDEHETGSRAHLNLGHTLGHAIETASHYARSHGECVALGMIAALRIAVALGDATRGDLARMTRLLAALGLGTELDAALAQGDLAAFLAADKKRDAGQVRFVVPGAPGQVRIAKLDAAAILALAHSPH